MKAYQFIEKLQSLINAYGDLEIKDDNENQVSPEFYNEDDVELFIIA